MPPSSRKKSSPDEKKIRIGTAHGQAYVIDVSDAPAEPAAAQAVDAPQYQRDHSKPQLEVWERLDCGHGIILFTDVGQPLPQIHELVMCPRCNANRIILGAILAQPALP